MAPKKTPSETRPPAQKTTKKVTKEAGSGEVSKKRNKRRTETFAIYIYKVLR